HPERPLKGPRLASGQRNFPHVLPHFCNTSPYPNPLDTDSDLKSSSTYPAGTGSTAIRPHKRKSPAFSAGLFVSQIQTTVTRSGLTSWACPCVSSSQRDRTGQFQAAQACRVPG